MTTSKLTIQKAVRLAEDGDPDLLIAASAMDGHLVGRLADTTRAWRWMAGHLPPRAHREFTLSQWVRTVYDVRAGRYVRRIAERYAMRTPDVQTGEQMS